MKRAQVSSEILVLIGVMLLLLLPLLLYAHSRANLANEDMSVQKAQFAAQRLSSAADSVGHLGGAAALVEELEIPANVKSITVSGTDIVFEMDSASGKKQLVKSCSFWLESDGLGRIRKAGTYFIKVSALPPGSSAQVRIELA